MSMNAPVVTGSSGPDYEPYRKAINEIVYSKKKWQEGQGSGNQGLKDWAAGNATQYYDQLPTELSTRLKGMSVDQASSLLSGGTGLVDPPVDSRLPNEVNPYDQKVTDLLGQLEGSISTPEASPYDDQIAGLLASLTSRINNPTSVDPRTTAEFAAGKASVDRGVQDNIRQAQESMGASGFARSTNLSERAQGIAQSGTEYLETQLVPQIAQQLMAQDQQGLANSMGLLNALSQQQGVFDSRQQAELQNLGSLLSALTGQQGVTDSRQQNQFQNQLGLDTFDLNKEGQEFTQDFNTKQAEVQNELAALNSAMQRTQTFGSVSGKDASILGVPAGTATFEAKEAIAQRKFALEQLNKQLGAQAEQNRLSRNAQASESAANRRESAANRASSEKSAKINELLSIWQATGSAPKGLEAYGVSEKQSYNPSLTPGEQMDQLKLDQELKSIDEQARIDKLVPGFQKSYGMDTMTAEAVASAMDNPTLESALADIKSFTPQLTQMGVDTKALRAAVTAEFNKKNGGSASSGGGGSSFFSTDNLKDNLGSTAGGLAALVAFLQDKVNNPFKNPFN